MARNKSSKGMAAGLFGQPSVIKEKTEQGEAAKMKTEPAQVTKVQREKQAVKREQITINKGGRPRDSDLKDGEEVIKTSIQLTDEVLYKLDAYLLTQKGKTRSRIVRELVRKYL